MLSDNKTVETRHERPNSNSLYVHSWTRMKSRCPLWNDKLEWRSEQLMMRLKKDCRWSPAARPPRTRSQEEWAKILRSRQYWSNLPLTSPILRNRRAPSCQNGSTNTWCLGSTSWTALVILFQDRRASMSILFFLQGTELSITKNLNMSFRNLESVNAWLDKPSIWLRR